ncbi:MAG: hypothetical protein QME57_05285 [Patescibacteria group bacterium]|nr:hypothetical protein [Patescibacteria group bacterium]
MIENTEFQKLKKQYPEFFSQFSEKFWDFLFSEDTAFRVVEICIKNGVENEEEIEKIASRITLVLLNQIPKENLTEVLMKGVRLDSNTANQISQEAEKLIFSQVPEILKEEEFTQPAPSVKPELKPLLEIKPEEKPKEARKDIYREPIE